MPTNYWNDRNIRTQTRLQNKSVAEIEKEQARLYKKAMKQTIKDFESTYNKYLLQLAEGQEPSPALMYNMDKYWQMQADLRERCKELGDKEVELYSKQFEEYYQDIYDSTVLPSADSFHTISTGNAEQVVNQVWCADGKSWSSRVWNNQSYLQQTLNNQLINCVTTGANPARLTRLLTERFNVARHRANALVRTEMAHITTQAAKNRYLDYGLEEYEFLADPDERTCEECAELDGKRFKLSEMDAGVNAPPIHPNDRCTIIPIIPDEVEIPVEKEVPMVEQNFTTSVQDELTAEGREMVWNSWDEYREKYVGHAVKIADVDLNDSFMHDTVNLSRLPVETQQQIYKTVENLEGKYYSPLTKLSVMDAQETAFSGREFASVTHQWGTASCEMKFNPVKIKNTERLYELSQSGYSIAYEKGKEIEYVATHEFGHTIINLGEKLPSASQNFVDVDFTSVKKARKELEVIQKEYADTLAKAQSEYDAIRKPIEEKMIFGTGDVTDADRLAIKTAKDKVDEITISRYANSKPDEFVAEAFADAEIGINPSEYSLRVRDVITKYFGKD